MSSDESLWFRHAVKLSATDPPDSSGLGDRANAAFIEQRY
jgi:hypothetical protein